MMASRTVLVIGNSVAAMMAALSLGEAGWQVTLVPPSKRLGGHFGGVVLGDTVFDAGMVLLEFTAYNADASADIRTYDPRRRNDVGRFFPLVADTLGKYSAFETVETPRMRLQGRTLPDLLIANRTEALRALDAPARDAMMGELAQLTREGQGPLHASKKATAPAFATATLEEASVANHGATLHSILIAPFCRKVTARPASDFLAAYHRLAWIPLLHPETLASALEGHDTLPETSFSQPRLGSVAALIQAIERKLRATPGVSIVEGAPAGLTREGGEGPVTLLLADGDVRQGERMVWAADQERLLSFVDPQPLAPLDKASIALASVLVTTDAMCASFSTMLIPENEAWPFRVTIQDPPRAPRPPVTRISCEWNAAFLRGTPDDVARRTREALVELEVIRDVDAVTGIRVDVMKDALLLPTAANALAWSARRGRLDELCGSVPRIGPASPFGATSLNDHIVQGLKVVHDLREDA